MVGDDIPGLFPIIIGDCDLRIYLLRLFSKHITQPFMQPPRKFRVELHKYRLKYYLGGINFISRCIGYHLRRLHNPPGIPSCVRLQRYHMHLA